MNTKLTLSLEKEIIEQAKVYAKGTGRSLSQMVESYFRNGGFKENEYTIIRYHSNKGKIRYAYIQHDDQISGLYLGLVTFERDNYEYKTYREEDLDMFSGSTD